LNEAIDDVLRPLISDRITRRQAVNVIIRSCEITSPRPPKDVVSLLLQGKSKPVSLAAFAPLRVRGREQLRKIANGLAALQAALYAAGPEIRRQLSRAATMAVPDLQRPERDGVVALLRALVAQIAAERLPLARGDTLRVRQALKLAIALIIAAPEADARRTALQTFPRSPPFEINATWTFDGNSSEAKAIATAFGDFWHSGALDITSAVSLMFPPALRATPLDIVAVLNNLRQMCQEQIDRIDVEVPATDAQLHHLLRLATVAAVFKHHELAIGTGTDSPFVAICEAVGVSRKFVRTWLGKLDIDRFASDIYGEP
jgi:hypothetical protein